MTPEASLMVRVADALNECGIPYMLAGSFSSNYDQARFQRRVELQLFGRRLWLPTPEDVIVMKIRWGRGRDKDDVRAVIGVQGERLDWPYIEGWCELHGTRVVLEEIRRTVPNI